MRVSDLPLPLQELAMRRHKEHPIKCGDIDSLFSSIVWERTPEGVVFWGTLHAAESMKELENNPLYYPFLESAINESFNIF